MEISRQELQLPGIGVSVSLGSNLEWRHFYSFIAGVAVFVYQGFQLQFLGDSFYFIQAIAFALGLYCIYLRQIFTTATIFSVGYSLPLIVRNSLKYLRGEDQYNFFVVLGTSLLTTFLIALSALGVGYSLRFLMRKASRRFKGKISYRG